MIVTGVTRVIMAVHVVTRVHGVIVCAAGNYWVV
jgi:hypothetical protein